MRPGRIILLVLGSLFALIGLGLLAGGAVLGWGLATQRDDDGYFSTSSERLSTETYAITSDTVDLGDPGPGEWWADRETATVRFRADNAGAGDVFVGIGAAVDVESYLAGVPHDEVSDVDFGPFEVDYRRENGAGEATPAPPVDQAFWVARATGLGTQTLTWDVEPGEWVVVLMNADGGSTVAADVGVGVTIEYLVPLAFGLAGAGVLLLAIGAAMIIGGVARPEALAITRRAPGTGVSVIAPSPVRFEGHLDPSVSRWQWLVKWFLAIPHVIVLILLWIAFVATTIVAWFAILFTGRYPRSIFDFNVGVLRWSWRVGFYAFSAIGTDEYPPFTLADADYPARLDVAYPERLSRGLVLVKSWLLALPHLLIVGALTSAWTWDGDGADEARSVVSGGLLSLLVVIAGFALLFTARYPRGLFDFVLGVNRWAYRVVAYVALMTDRYPPFRLDQGPTEPSTSAPMPTRPAPPPPPVETAPAGRPPIPPPPPDPAVRWAPPPPPRS